MEIFLCLPDKEPPDVTCPANLEACTEIDSSRAVVNWPLQPAAVDAVDGYINPDCRDENGQVVVSGGMYDLGVTSITCTAQDASGNLGVCAFNITVIGMSTVPWFFLFFCSGLCLDFQL